MAVLANLIVKMSADTSALERGLKGALALRATELSVAV